LRIEEESKKKHAKIGTEKEEKAFRLIRTHQDQPSVALSLFFLFGRSYDFHSVVVAAVRAYAMRKFQLVTMRTFHRSEHAPAIVRAPHTPL